MNNVLYIILIIYDFQTSIPFTICSPFLSKILSGFSLWVSFSGSRPSKICCVAEWQMYRKTQSSHHLPHTFFSPCHWIRNKNLSPIFLFNFFFSFFSSSNSYVYVIRSLRVRIFVSIRLEFHFKTWMLIKKDHYNDATLKCHMSFVKTEKIMYFSPIIYY